MLGSAVHYALAATERGLGRSIPNSLHSGPARFHSTVSALDIRIARPGKREREREMVDLSRRLVRSPSGLAPTGKGILQDEPCTFAKIGGLRVLQVMELVSDARHLAEDRESQF